MQRSNVRFNASSKSAVQTFTPRLRLAMLASAMAFALVGASAAMAQTAAAPAKAGEQKAYVPDVGQEGKDVIWVPTPQSLVDKMLDMAARSSRPRSAA